MKKQIYILLGIMSSFLIGSCSLIPSANNPSGKQKLDTPKELRIENYDLVWNPVLNAEKYLIDVDGKQSYANDSKYELNNVSDGIHSFKVLALGDNTSFEASDFCAPLQVKFTDGGVENDDYYGQFDDLTKRESFLGYGFDTIASSLFSDQYIKTSFPLFKTDELLKQRLLKIDSKYTLVEEVKSSNMDQFLADWNAKANVNVEWGKKKVGGSVGVKARYSGGVDNARSKYFHSISFYNRKYYIVLQADRTAYRNMLSQGFETDLYSDMEPGDLFNTYGTHFITSAIMGGRINSYYLYTSTEEKSYTDISAEVSVEVRAYPTKVNVDVEGGYHSKASKQNIDIVNSLEVMGGGDFGLINDSDIASHYAEWEASLNEHPSLMGIKDTGSLVPIWDLIDVSKDTKTYSWDYGDGYAGEGSRSQQLQAYFAHYGMENYNALMEAAGLPQIVEPTEITDIKIGGEGPDSATGSYYAFAGMDNDIQFSFQPAEAKGFQKSASISSGISYARIVNDSGRLSLQVDADAPVNSVLTVRVSYGPVSKTVTVRITKNCIVTFEPNNGGSLFSVTVRQGSVVDEPRAPVKDGYNLVGWYTDMNCTEGNKFAFGQTPVIDNITLYAKWRPVSEEEVTISFYHNISGPFINPITIQKGGTLERPADPQFGDYTFVDFYKDATFNILFDFTQPIEIDTVIYVKWELIASAVTLIDMTGSNATKAYVVNGNQYNGAAPSKPTRNGYLFLGYFDQAAVGSGDRYINDEMNIVKSINSEMVLYAHWIPLSKRIVNNQEGMDNVTHLEINKAVSDPDWQHDSPYYKSGYTNAELQEAKNCGFNYAKVTIDIDIEEIQDGWEWIAFKGVRNGRIVQDYAMYKISTTEGAWTSVKLGFSISIDVLLDSTIDLQIAYGISGSNEHDAWNYGTVKTTIQPSKTSIAKYANNVDEGGPIL